MPAQGWADVEATGLRSCPRPVVRRVRRVEAARALRLVGRGIRPSSLRARARGAAPWRLGLLLGVGGMLAVVLGYVLGGGRAPESTVWPLRGSTQVDEVHLSWAGDPRTTAAIAWRSTPWAGNAAL